MGALMKVSIALVLCSCIGVMGNRLSVGAKVKITANDVTDYYYKKGDIGTVISPARHLPRYGGRGYYYEVTIDELSEGELIGVNRTEDMRRVGRTVSVFEDQLALIGDDERQAFADGETPF